MPANNQSVKSLPTWLNFLIGIIIAGFAIYIVKFVNDNSSLNYYLTLIIVAFGSSLALFSIQKSSASFKGKTKYGDLNLGGPVVVFFLVIIGGYKLADNNFDFTINVYDTKSGAITNGSLILSIEDEKKPESINDKGQAVFKHILSGYKGTNATVEPHIPHYPSLPVNIKIPDDKSVLAIKLEKIPDSVSIHGMVLNKLQQPLKNVTISFMGGSIITTTNEYGSYFIKLPVAEGSEVSAMIVLHEKTVFNDQINVSSKNEINFYLKNK